MQLVAAVGNAYRGVYIQKNICFPSKSNHPVYCLEPALQILLFCSFILIECEGNSWCWNVRKDLCSIFMTDWPFDKADNPTANKLAKIVVSESQHPIVKFEIKTSKQKKKWEIIVNSSAQSIIYSYISVLSGWWLSLWYSVPLDNIPIPISGLL